MDTIEHKNVNNRYIVLRYYVINFSTLSIKRLLSQSLFHIGPEIHKLGYGIFISLNDNQCKTRPFIATEDNFTNISDVKAKT